VLSTVDYNESHDACDSTQCHSVFGWDPLRDSLTGQADWSCRTLQ